MSRESNDEKRFSSTFCGRGRLRIVWVTSKTGAIFCFLWSELEAVCSGADVIMLYHSAYEPARNFGFVKS
jgi:hypothetical protein